MNQWWSDVNYNELLESFSKEIIKLQVFQFLCSVISQKGEHYSKTSLKNALSVISHHFQDIKPGSKHANLCLQQIVNTPNNIIYRKTQQKMTK
ncbi:10781_t:CDS:2, partial [Racocetra fulgida]